MSAEYICDGCGKQAKDVHYPNGQTGWHKPNNWYQRQDEDGPRDACSRECIEKFAVKSGKTGVVLPI